MEDREHIIQWAVIKAVDNETAEIIHQFDEDSEPKPFQEVLDMGDDAKVLFAVPREQRIGTDEAIGSPFVAVDLENGEINVNGTQWDFTYPEIRKLKHENDLKRQKAIREARQEKEQEAYDEMVEKTRDWDDREAATEAARKAKKLSDEEYELIDSMALDDLDLDEVDYKPIFYATTQEDLVADDEGKLVRIRPPRFKYYKVGWECEIDSEIYQRVVYIDMDTGKFLLRNNR